MDCRFLLVSLFLSLRQGMQCAYQCAVAGVRQSGIGGQCRAGQARLQQFALLLQLLAGTSERHPAAQQTEGSDPKRCKYIRIYQTFRERRGRNANHDPADVVPLRLNLGVPAVR